MPPACGFDPEPRARVQRIRSAGADTGIAWGRFRDEERREEALVLDHGSEGHEGGGRNPAGESLPPTGDDQRHDQASLKELQRARQIRVVKVLVALVILVILAIFVIGNSQRVPVDFVFGTHRARLIWVMIGCIVLGGIAGYLIGRPGRQVRFRHRAEHDRGKAGPEH
jgi:uncharacterized integral membrane protein